MIPMKDMSPENWLYWLGLLAILCMLLPVTMILLKKKLNTGFVALSVYFIMIFIYNLVYIFIPKAPIQIMRIMAVVTNMLDAPLMLLFLINFTLSETIRKRIRISIILFVLFEIGVVAMYGFAKKSITIFSGVGILLVLYFAFRLFSRKVRVVSTKKVDVAKIMMISGILFAYGIYLMLYLFFYVLNTPNKEDALLIYYLASIVASILLSAGLVKEKERIKKVGREVRRLATLL
jgi:hypothetical protein